MSERGRGGEVAGRKKEKNLIGDARDMRGKRKGCLKNGMKQKRRRKVGRAERDGGERIRMRD